MIPPLGGPMSRSERIALVLGLLACGAMMWPVRDQLVDSAFVWQRIAGHLAAGRGLVFNVGERIYATTNPLWIALVADGIALGLDGLIVAKLLGAVSTLACVLLFMQLMRRTVRMPIVRAVATVAWACQAWMAQWSVSGLETSLATALVLAGFVALTEGPEWGDRPVRTGSLWALAALTRPGAVLLLVLWVTVLLIDARNRSGLRRLLFGTLPVIAIYGSWLVFARVYFHSFWPRVLSLPSEQAGSWGTWWHRLMTEFSYLALTDAPLYVVAVLAILFVVGRRGPTQRPMIRMLPVLWVIMLPALFAARSLGAGSRQIMLVMPVAQAVAWQAIDRWWTGAEPRARAAGRAAILAGALGALLIAQNIGVYRTRVLPTVRGTTEALRSSVLVWGPWLRAHAPRSSVASEVTGLLAQTSGLRVIDLGGLMTSGMLEVRSGTPRDRILPLLAFESVGRAEYAVDRGRTPEELLASCPYPGAFQTLDRRGDFTLYRIHWSAVDSTRAAH